jgi:hypothetical protein
LDLGSAVEKPPWQEFARILAPHYFLVKLDARRVKRLSFTHPRISFPHTPRFAPERECMTGKLAGLSQLRTFFGFFVLIFIVKRCVFSVAL